LSAYAYNHAHRLRMNDEEKECIEYSPFPPKNVLYSNDKQECAMKLRSWREQVDNKIRVEANNNEILSPR